MTHKKRQQIYDLTYNKYHGISTKTKIIDHKLSVILKDLIESRPYTDGILQKYPNHILFL